MANIWTLRDPIRCGGIKLAPCGREKIGTVIKSGFMKKTVTVAVDQSYMHTKFTLLKRSTSKFQVHDEDEICKTGDKIIIRACHPVSVLKHYYVRSFVWMVPRHNFTINKMLNFEKRGMVYNEKIRNSISLANFNPKEKI
jgi:small subunit ribosomal protein S17